MKLIFNKNLIVSIFCFFIFSLNLEARDIILIENMATKNEGELLKSILINKFKLPTELITLRNIHGVCEKKTEAIIYLCLDGDGKLEIKKIDQFVVKNSLGVFLNQNEMETK